MIRRCKGNCGKFNTCQPYNSARTVEYLCDGCRGKYATPIAVSVQITRAGTMSKFLSLRATANTESGKRERTKAPNRSHRSQRR